MKIASAAGAGHATASAYSVLHLITGLDVGGAELALARLVGGLSARGVRNVVVSLLAPGPVAARINAAGVEVESLHLARGTLDPRAVSKLRAVLHRARPNVIQTWMYHADLLGTLARGRRSAPALVWSVRASNVDMRHYRPLSALTRRACAWLSARPDAIVANSNAGVRFHQQLGYRPRRWIVIPNGVDVDTFRPDADDRRRVRQELRVPEDVPVIGLIARLDPMKGHAVFLEAGSLMLAADPRLHLVLAGEGVVRGNEPFHSWLRERGDAGARVRLLGRRDDMDRIQRALDVACSSSLFGEGFPNVLAEAMACGVPVVATDVGDAADVVGPAGFIVPAGAPADLAERCLGLVADTTRRRLLGQAARARVVEMFALGRAVDLHDALYREIIAASAAV